VRGFFFGSICPSAIRDRKDFWGFSPFGQDFEDIIGFQVFLDQVCAFGGLWKKTPKTNAQKPYN